MAPEPANLRLLVVDDEHDVLVLFLRRLSREGFEVVCSGAVEEAFDLLTEGRFDAALIDLYFGILPRGLDLVERIRSDPRTAGLPVISMSGGGERALERCLGSGADAALAKPFYIREFLEAYGRARLARGG